MKLILNDQFEVCGYINPGAPSKIAMESAKNDIKNLTVDDFLILCCRTNDVNNNNLSKVFHDVTSFAKRIKHTNLILISIPYRHDCGNFHINREIKAFNRKLSKLAKIFPVVNVIEVDNNRQLFTAHGLHLNGLGKRVTFKLFTIPYLFSPERSHQASNNSYFAGKLFTGQLSCCRKLFLSGKYYR
jgi:hypothetical protein